MNEPLRPIGASVPPTGVGSRPRSPSDGAFDGWLRRWLGHREDSDSTPRPPSDGIDLMGPRQVLLEILRRTVLAATRRALRLPPDLPGPLAAYGAVRTRLDEDHLPAVEDWFAALVSEQRRLAALRRGDAAWPADRVDRALAVGMRRGVRAAVQGFAERVGVRHDEDGPMRLFDVLAVRLPTMDQPPSTTSS